MDEGLIEHGCEVLVGFVAEDRVLARHYDYEPSDIKSWAYDTWYAEREAILRDWKAAEQRWLRFEAANAAEAEEVRRRVKI